MARSRCQRLVVRFPDARVRARRSVPEALFGLRPWSLALLPGLLVTNGRPEPARLRPVRTTLGSLGRDLRGLPSSSYRVGQVGLPLRGARPRGPDEAQVRPPS